MKQKNFLTTLFCFFLAVNFFAADIYVQSSGSNATGDGSIGSPYATIGFAVGLASSGDTIFVVGTVSEAGQITIDGKNLTFQGQSNAIIERQVGASPPETGRIINVTGTTILLFKNIIFQNANASVQGTVVNTTSNNVSLTFEDCLFQNNVGSNQNGNVIHIGNADATFTRCTFYNNTATATTGRGAAIIFGGTFTGTITNCTFYQNKLTVNTTDNIGAAIVSFTLGGNPSAQALTITNSLFANNTNADGDNVDIQYPSENLSIVNSLAENTEIGATNNTISPTSNLSADFTNTTFSFVSPKVNYTAANDLASVAGNDTPIDFGADNNDAGAWNSGINIFEGTTASWETATNWSSGNVPTGDGTEDIAIIGSFCNMFANGVAVNNIKITKELRIQNQRVFIVNGESDISAGGLVRYFTDLQDDADNTKAWYLVSSPLSGEVFDAAFADKNDLSAGTTNSNRGVASYVPGTNTWNYLSSTTTTMNATSGSGFSMKITPDGITFAASGGEYADNTVGFEGDFNTDDAGVTTGSLPVGFNLLGNPYAAHLNSATFLGAVTSANLDQTQIWVWNQAMDMYEVKPVGTSFILAPAQGFFVKVNTAGSVNFAESNQATSGGTFQKTSMTELKLLMSDGESNRFAKLYFSDNATKGFDYGWEGETFGGIPSSLDVFTNLVEQNQGKKYQVQSLPNSELTNMIIPVGVISDAGKELTFSTEMVNFPSDVKVYLEDRVNNTFNVISDTKIFKVILNEALNGVGRFYVHASKSSLSTENDLNLASSVSIYKANATTLRIVGLQEGRTNIKLFNILGMQVFNSSFKNNGVQDISLPRLPTGVYIVQLETEEGNLNKKIVLE